MNVRDDGDAHRARRTVAKRAALLGLALAGAVSGALLWRTQVPRLDLPALDPRAYFPAAELERIAAYRRGARLLFLSSLAVQLAVLGLLAWKAGALADGLAGLARGRVRTGVFVGVAVVAALWLATLPLDAVAHRRRRRFGLSEQAYGGWLRDEVVALGLRAVLVSLAVAGVLALAGWLGREWWLVGAPALVGVAVVYVLAQPLVVQPLFNRFEPLADPALTARIESLGRELGVEVRAVAVADASRRTTAGNAYVAGIGPTKRVVLYDTLLDGRFGFDEVAAVSAHELAHVERRHVWKGLAWFALLAVPAVFGLARVTAAKGGLADPALVPLALLLVFAYLLVTAPLANAVSRRYESEADWLALRATQDPDAVIGLDRRLVLTGLGDPDPPTWSYVWLSTHPSAMERIAMAEAFRIVARRGARAGS